MTFGEIDTVVSCYQDEQEDKAKEIIAANYNISSLTASFVLSGLNGKSIPSISELYPDLFTEQTNEVDKTALLKEAFIDFANAHNKQNKRK